MKKVLKVLNVEDSEQDAALLTRHLKRAGYDLISERVETRAAMRATLKTQAWDVILSDYSMPHFGALDALATLKETGLDIPFIVISGTIGESVVVETMLAGADDYLMKDDLLRLVPAIERGLQMAESRRARRQAEDALRESEDRYRDLVEHSHDLICTHDLEGKILSVNQASMKLLGYDRETLLSKNIRDILFSGLRDEFDNYIAELLADGVSQGLMSVQTRTGERRILEYTNTLRTEGVTSPVVRGIAHDITEQKRADAALRDSEERYRLMFENNPHVMWVYDLETLRFLAVNDTAVRHYGYSREEFLAMTVKDIRPTEDIPALMDNISQVSEGLDQAGLWRHRRKDGTIIGVEITSHFLNFAGRRAEVVLVNDVTEHRQLEEQLRQSQKMEAVGRLAGGIAHDFNNLLTVINGYGDLLLWRLPPEDSSRHYLEEIKKAGARAASLTRQLLAFSRRQVLQPEVLDLNAVVSDLERMLHRLIGEDIELRTNLDPVLWRIKADPGQIEQVIMNLIINARDAMPQGGKLTIETRNQFLDEEYARQHVLVRPGHYVMLAVSDTGIGIDEKTQAHIFEPFFTTKEAGKGTGLGLSTAYGIVNQSDGHISVSSEVRQGATFRIYLPMVGEPARKTEQVIERAAMFLGAETILLVEDEEVVRNLARQALEMYGYHVLQAGSGKAAISICERHAEPIQLLITDVVMPGMSGRELAEYLSPLRREMKVLYMSGYTDDAIVHQGVLGKETNFIQKPFSLDDLARKVREVLDKNQ
jgi:two-component system cell cycle sensor histidine kinase/response regulator CckA